MAVIEPVHQSGCRYLYGVCKRRCRRRGERDGDAHRSIPYYSCHFRNCYCMFRPKHHADRQRRYILCLEQYAGGICCRHGDAGHHHYLHRHGHRRQRLYEHRNRNSHGQYPSHGFHQWHAGYLCRRQHHADRERRYILCLERYAGRISCRHCDAGQQHYLHRDCHRR